MLYYLFNYLDQLDFPGAGMFKYVSFRSALALILSLFISTAIGRRIIDKLQMLQIGETVRNLGLEGQMSKKETPTMGGFWMIISRCSGRTRKACTASSRLSDRSVWG